MAKVFVSYSRKDIEFAKLLTAELQKSDLDFWIDWEGIPPTVDWWREIEKGIEEADVFLFLISSDSSASKVCGKEIDCAVKNAKRIIPLVVRDIKGDEAPQQLSHLNWIFFREGDDFDAALKKLMTAIQTDYEWAATQRRLQIKALDWERNSKENGFLLRGMDLLDAEQDLATNTSKDPHPTDLQREYVLASRRATDRQRRILTSISIVGVIALAVLAVFGFYQAGVANKNLFAAQIAQADTQNQQITAINNGATAVANEKEAEKQATISRSGELAAQAQSLINDDLPDALLLGIESFHTWNTLQSRNALMNITIANPQLLRSIRMNAPFNAKIVFSPDGNTLVAGGCKDAGCIQEGEITLWTAAGEFLGQFIPPTGHMDSVTGVAFSPDGKILASSSKDSISFWNVGTHQMTDQLTPHKQLIYSIAFSPDGRLLASGSRDGNVLLWDVKTQQLIDSPIKHEGLTSIAFSPDGKVLASGGVGTIMLWDIETGQPVKDAFFTESELYTVYYPLAFSPDGKTLASGTNTGTITLWDLEEHEAIRTFTEHSGGISAIQFNPDGKTMATGAEDQFIVLWDMENLQPKSRLSANIPTLSLSFSPDGKTFVSGSEDYYYEYRVIIFWSTTPYSAISKFIPNTSLLNDVALNPDGKTLASGGCDKYDSDNNCSSGEIKFWDAATGKSIGQTLAMQTMPTSIAFNPDGKSIASGYCKKDDTNGACKWEIFLWSLETGRPIGEPFTGDIDGVQRLVFSPDGKSLVSLSQNKTIVWDVLSGHALGEITTKFPPWSVAFSSDGSVLALGDINGSITLWNTATKVTIDPPLHHTPPDVMGTFIFSVTFSPNGRILASAASDGTIVLWNLETQNPLYPPLTTDYVKILAFSPDGKTLISGGNSTYLWDVETGQLLGQPIKPLREFPYLFATSSDGKRLASVDEQGIMLWDLSSESWQVIACQRAGRNFTRAEWAQYFPNEDYPTDPKDATCPQWPLDTETISTPTP